MESDRLESIDRFNMLLKKCYNGSLKDFCLDFDIKSRGESFYKKVQKSRNRMMKQKVSIETIEEFQKYICFLEFKILEKDCSWEEKKALNEFKSFL
jgi:hypothetical protein